MSKRLQVLLPDQEMAAIQQVAERESLSVGEWVRRTLKNARALRSEVGPETKLAAIRHAASYSFPVADIEQMNREIESGYAE